MRGRKRYGLGHIYKDLAIVRHQDQGTQQVVWGMETVRVFYASRLVTAIRTHKVDEKPDRRTRPHTSPEKQDEQSHYTPTSNKQYHDRATEGNWGQPLIILGYR